MSALFAGGLCFIALVLLPKWRELPAARQHEHFLFMLARAETLMPRLARAVAVCLLALIGWQARSGAVAAPLWAAAAMLAAVFAISLTVNVPINRRIAEGAISDEDRRRWDRGHLGRTGAGVLLLIALLS